MHFTEFHVRLAAYGLAVNTADEVLVTWFNGSTGAPACWTMPGGGVEFDENCSDAVIREFFEETGYHVTPGPILGEHHTTFPATADRAPVRSQRFLFAVTVESGVLGTTEVGGTTEFARWVPRPELRSLTPRADIVDVAADALDRPARGDGQPNVNE
ncbi:NUDIX hydrolase [Tsukamurella pseudospumae]|uniref:Nudix hydrolase domain-containing protein n=1 Tax=Tsukamurella pseudospumae TaxID=239498 RepID=A0A138AED1_9ACTN|nr:NUDIX domain-containing protein [Tsukamurella pseudospumae]KXP00760.1 hypothetical protein AXK61_14290 [Tsukamurella pseudospumae]KXP08770.1 hypothetical protein AXK60_08870 [Tsukamurella pseudospumae]